MSGLTTAQMSFSVPKDIYAPRAAEVTLTGVGDLPTFYIANRSYSNGKCTVTCYDRMAFADTAFPYESFSDNDISITDICVKIAEVCGINGVVGIPSCISSLPMTKLMGTCGDIMSEIASVCCGFWRVSYDNRYEFVPFGSYTATMTVKQHSALNVGAEFEVLGVHGTDGSGNTFTSGMGAIHSYDGIKVEGDLVTAGLVNEIWGRAEGHIMTAVSCDNAIVSSVPEINTEVTFGQGGSYIINDISCRISAGGIIASLRGNAPDGDEIGTRGYISRKLDQSARLGRQMGGMIITPYQGIVYKSEGGSYGQQTI